MLPPLSHFSPVVKKEKGSGPLLKSALRARPIFISGGVPKGHDNLNYHFRRYGMGEERASELAVIKRKAITQGLARNISGSDACFVCFLSVPYTPRGRFMNNPI